MLYRAAAWGFVVIMPQPDVAAAQCTALPCDTTLYGTIGSPADVDCYTFSVTQNGSILRASGSRRMSYHVCRSHRV